MLCPVHSYKHFYYLNSSPTPVVTWERVLPPRSELPITSRIEDYGQTLVIEDMRSDYEGTYECTGLNEEGHTPVERSVNLKVEGRFNF